MVGGIHGPRPERPEQMPTRDDAAQRTRVLGDANLRPFGKLRRPKFGETLNAACMRTPQCSGAEGGCDIPPPRRAVGRQRERGTEPVFIERGRAATLVGSSQECHYLRTAAAHDPSPLFPSRRQLAEIELALLCGPCGGPRDVRTPGRVGPPLGHVPPDIRRARRELTDGERGDSYHFGPQARRLGPRHAQTRCELHSQVRFVDGRCRTTMCRQAAVVTCTPPAVGAVDHVGHHDMRVEMGVEVPVDPVGERGRDEARGRHHMTFLTRTPLRAETVRLDVGQRATHALAVGRDDMTGHLVSAQGEDHAHRLRCAERQVEATHGGTIRAQPMSRCGVTAFENGPQGRWIERATQSESFCRAPRPSGGPVVPTCRQRQLSGHVIEVVVGPCRGEAVDSQHLTSPTRCAHAMGNGRCG